MKHLRLFAVATLARATTAAAQTPPDLEARIRALEARVQALTAAATPAPAPAPAPSTHLDVREPPFGHADFSWMNGNNYQPTSPLRIGPVTPTFFVDTFYAWQFARPQDHTIFQSTTAPRHNEFTINLAYLGVELNGIDTPAGGPIGRLELQFGTNNETDQGQDASVMRGSYLTHRSMNYLKQAAGGWHFHWLHGVNIEFGIFPSYIALESYVPQENWNYTHPFVSDFTPYYFSGSRTQIFPSQRTKIELWLVNGWQTFGRWHDALAGGYLVNWRPSGRLSLTHTAYVGQEQPADPDALRFYTDNYAQVRLFHDERRRFFQSLALCVVADLGYERRGAASGVASGVMGGASLTARVEWTRNLMSTLRADVYYDQSGALVVPLPLGGGYSLPGNGRADNPFEWLGGGLTATMDWRPSPWLLVRLEYAHRMANQPYFSGPGGITGPNGVPPVDAAARAAFRPDLRDTDDRLIANMTLRM